MSASLSVLCLMSLLASPLDDSPGVELRYTGGLNKIARSGDNTAVKRFSVYALIHRDDSGPRQLSLVWEERGGGSWPWFHRLASATLDKEFRPIGNLALRMLYDHEGTPTPVSVVLPLLPAAEDLKQGAKWTQGRETWEVTRSQKVLGRTCWQIEASTNFGRRRTVWVEQGTPIVVALDEKLFVGQGEEHLLQLQLESVTPVDAEKLKKVVPPLQTLLKLKGDLQKGELEHRPELTEAQLKTLAAAVPGLEKAVEDTPLSHFVSVVARDVRAQQSRVSEVGKLAEQFVGKPAPRFALSLLDKAPFDPAALQGKVVILHFWDYQGEPLVEPYGQVGYLDFLAGKRKRIGVQVYGVGVDSRLANEATAAGPLRLIHKFKNTMNLSYPIATDDGSTLAKFGDPRAAGAKLPLWVVIGPDGKIAHYRTGFYKVNPDEGLRELDDLCIQLIKDHRAKQDAGKDKGAE